MWETLGGNNKTEIRYSQQFFFIIEIFCYISRTGRYSETWKPKKHTIADENVQRRDLNLLNRTLQEET